MVTLLRATPPRTPLPWTLLSIPHRAVKAPYSPAEVAAILRIARTQPSETTGRQVRACVGLGLGAGLDSVDLRQLRARDLEDGDDRGIRVQVSGRRERMVWVLEEFEELVRSSIVGLTPSQLVVGTSDNRKHVASKAYQQAVILADAPHFEQSRMRTTWLARLLNSRVPLPILMQAAGLTSARTITDLLPHLEPSAANEQQLLREGR